jgi:hypothetical protein
MLERFTREAREAVERAVGEPEWLGAEEAGPEHLPLALEGELEAAGVDGDALRRDASAVGGLDPEALATTAVGGLDPEALATFAAARR